MKKRAKDGVLNSSTITNYRNDRAEILTQSGMDFAMDRDLADLMLDDGDGAKTLKQPAERAVEARKVFGHVMSASEINEVYRHSKSRTRCRFFHACSQLNCQKLVWKFRKGQTRSPK